MSTGDIPSRLPSALAENDAILPFAVEALDQRGRVVRLSSTLDEILAAHDYPLPVAKLLGEAAVLAVMLGSSLKFEGRFILQTQSDGPVSMLVVDFISPSSLRACARFNAERVAEAFGDQQAHLEGAAEADAARIEKAAAARGVSCAHQTVEVPAADYPALIEKVTRRFDICVMPLPSFESYSEDEKLFEGPLFRSGRPVLAVPGRPYSS